MTEGPYGQAAGLYVARGWLGPLPVPPRSKGPVPVGYTGQDGHWPSVADVYGWAEDRPEANLAIRLPRDVLGVDADLYLDKRGRSTLMASEASWGMLPPTWSTTSREDGSAIRLYRIPEGLRWPGQVGPGVELIRFGHRYAMAWPSIHPEGRIYRWHQDGVITEAIPAPTDLAELPRLWVQGLTGGEAEAAYAVAEMDTDEIVAWYEAHGQGRPCPSMRTSLERHLRGYADGSARHDWMVAAVFAVVMRMAEGHRGGAEAIRGLSSRWADLIKDDKGRDRSEWGRAVSGAIRKAAVTELAEADPCANLPGAWGPPGPVLVAGGQPTEDPGGAGGPHTGPVSGPVGPFVDWPALYEGDMAEVDWLVEGIIPAGPRVTMLWSTKSGDGKTLLAWELAVGIAQGTEVWGRAVDRPRRVLVIDYENSAGLDLLPRLLDMGAVKATDVANIGLVEHAGAVVPPLDTPEGGRLVLELVTAHRAEVLIIDTAPRSVAGPENEADTWHAFDRHTIAPLKAAGVTIVRLDQSGKDASRGPRGSRTKMDGVDIDWRLSAVDETTRTLELSKARLPVTDRELTLRMTTEPWLRHVVKATPAGTAHAAEVAAAIERLRAEGINPRDKGNRVQAQLRERGRGLRRAVLLDALKAYRLAYFPPGTTPLAEVVPDDLGNQLGTTPTDNHSQAP